MCRELPRAGGTSRCGCFASNFKHRGDESFADDLNMGRGIVSGRVALLLRSTEIQPHRPNDLLPPSTRQVQGEPVDRRQTLGKNRGPKPPRAVTHLEWARVGAEPRTWSGRASGLSHASRGPTPGWSQHCQGGESRHLEKKFLVQRDSVTHREAQLQGGRDAA